MSHDYENQIYIGTILLEKNRWAEVRTPSIVLSDWAQRIADEGFDGMELWQNHALLASEEERQKLLEGPAPVKIFNSYARCETEDEQERIQSAEMAKFFSAAGMKFNFGKDQERHQEYCKTVKAWRAMLPADFRFLCECHGGTSMQEPEKAAETFGRIWPDDYEVIIHGFGGEDDGIRRVFEIHGARITHIHASLTTKEKMPEDQVRKRLDLLRESGFRGSFTIEFTEGVRGENVEVETLFRNAARDMKLLRRCMK